MEALGERTVDELTRVDFYTSHEGLNLHYESAQTRTVPRRDGHYLLTTHMPWIGERTRRSTARTSSSSAASRTRRREARADGDARGRSSQLVDVLEPDERAGQASRSSRAWAPNRRRGAPAAARRGREPRRQARALGVRSDARQHADVSPGGLKTRNFDDILREIERDVRRARAHGLDARRRPLRADGRRRHRVHRRRQRRRQLRRGELRDACDPRLNYRPGARDGFLIGRRLQGRARLSTRQL